MTSIRIYLIVTLISMITLVNFISAFQGYRNGLQEVALLLDERLIDRADLIHAYSFSDRTQQNREKMSQNITPKIITKRKASSFIFQVWSQEGELLSRSENAPSALLFPLKDHAKTVNVNLSRWFAMSIYYPSSAIWVVVAERNDIRHQIAEGIILESTLPIVLMLPVIGGFVWLFVTFSLKPIAKLTKQIKQKKRSDLSPITTELIPQELTALAQATNSLLERLEASFVREKRFVADAAHELRTPLSTLKVHMQNLEDEIPAKAESAEDLKVGIDRMGHLVEQLLTLNRSTADISKTHFSRVDLAAIIKKVIGEQMCTINEKKQTISFSGEAPEIYGNPFSIEMLIHNLLSNAIKYSHEEGEITLRIETQSNKTLVKVIDNGPGIPEHQRQKVFERFYRVGGDRHDPEKLGCGLGLSIVKRIVERHNATIFLEEAPGSTGLSVTVQFPDLAGGL